MLTFSISPSVTAFTTTSDIGNNIPLLASSINLPPASILNARQTHSANVRLIGKEFFSLAPATRATILNDVDALITSLPRICLTVSTADCTPVLVFDPIHHAIAAIHSGWRGTLQNIVHATLLAMRQAFSSRPDTFLVAIGPSIAQANYEVGFELLDQFSAVNEEYADFFQTSTSVPPRLTLDVCGIVQHQLKSEGVKPENILVSTLDTFTSSNLFSARRDGGATGRNLNGIFLNA